MVYDKAELTNKNKLHKHVVVNGTASETSRVLTLLDLLTLVKKDVPAAVIDIDPVRTSKVFTLPSWVEGSGVQNKRSKVATWDDAVEFINSAGGTINVDLGPETTGGVSRTTTEMKTYPSYLSGTAPTSTSEFITYAEMTYLMNNSTFI